MACTAFYTMVGVYRDQRFGIKETGFYVDTLERDHGVWRIKRREVHDKDMPRMVSGQ